MSPAAKLVWKCMIKLRLRPHTLCLESYSTFQKGCLETEMRLFRYPRVSRVHGHEQCRLMARWQDKPHVGPGGLEVFDKAMVSSVVKVSVRACHTSFEMNCPGRTSRLLGSTETVGIIAVDIAIWRLNPRLISLKASAIVSMGPFRPSSQAPEL